MKFAASIACICLSASTLIAQSTNTSQHASGAARVDTRVDGIVAKMTLEEKLDYIGGTGFAIRAMPNLKLPLSLIHI